MSATLTVLVSASVAVAIPTPAHAATTTARDLLASATSGSENNTGYDRTLFQHWIDANGDCQNTRHEVLIAETKVAPTCTSA